MNLASSSRWHLNESMNVDMNEEDGSCRIGSCEAWQNVEPAG